MRVRDREQVAFDMWQAIHACCDYRRASNSSLRGPRSEQQAHAPADQRGSDGHANTNLPRAAASAVRKGGRVPKTEPPVEDPWQCPIEAGERLTIPFSLFRLPFGHHRPPGPDGMVPSKP